MHRTYELPGRSADPSSVAFQNLDAVVLCISLDPPLHGDPTPAEYGPVGTVFASPIESADPAVAVRDSAEFGVSCAVNALRGCLEAKVLLAMECGPDMASLDA